MDKKPSLLQFTMTYGAILGVVSIIFSLILYVTGFMPCNFKRMLFMSVVSLGLLVGFIIAGDRAYRDKVLGGSITFGHALMVGLFIVVFSTILSSFYSLVFNLYIDPEYMNRVFECSKNWTYDFMTRMGAPEGQIDQAMKRMEEQQADMTPLNTFFSGLYMSAIFGFILSLITSLFIKKNLDPFKQN
jgi:hypothetical protein